MNILNSTQPSKYNLNATVRMLIDELFIESISIENDFQMIYDECQPNKCTYSFNSSQIQISPQHNCILSKKKNNNNKAKPET